MPSGDTAGTANLQRKECPDWCSLRKAATCGSASMPAPASKWHQDIRAFVSQENPLQHSGGRDGTAQAGKATPRCLCWHNHSRSCRVDIHTRPREAMHSEALVCVGSTTTSHIWCHQTPEEVFVCYRQKKGHKEVPNAGDRL